MEVPGERKTMSFAFSFFQLVCWLMMNTKTYFMYCALAHIFKNPFLSPVDCAVLHGDISWTPESGWVNLAPPYKPLGHVSCHFVYGSPPGPLFPWRLLYWLYSLHQNKKTLDMQKVTVIHWQILILRSCGYSSLEVMVINCDERKPLGIPYLLIRQLCALLTHFLVIKLFVGCILHICNCLVAC